MYGQPGTRTGRGRGRSDPFPSRGRRTPRAQKEPSRRGAAHACRVVVSTPTASGPGAGLSAASVTTCA